VNVWLLAATVALLPLLLPRGPGESAPVDAVAVLFILVALAGLARRRRAFHLPAKGALSLIVGASLVATVLSLSVPHSMLSLLVEAYLYMLLVCVANDLGGNRRGLRVILTAWSIAALFWAAMLIGSHLELLPQGLQQALVENSRSGGYRVAGVSKNPNLAAGYMMTSFFVLLASPWPRRRPARLAAAAWLLAGLWVTGSNGALLGLATGVAVLAVAAGVRASRTPNQRLAVVGAALIASVPVLTGTVMVIGVPRVEVASLQAVARSERGGVFGASLGRLDRSVPTRLEIWRRAWRSAGSLAILGVGPGSAEKIPTPPGTLGRSLHNDYFAFLIERGVLGLLGLLGLCVVLLRWSGRLMGALPDGRWRLAGLGGAVVANLTLATNHELFHFRHVWVLIGLVWAANALVTGHQAAAANPACRGRGPRELADAGR
jgi:O-antigen ligase